LPKLFDEDVYKTVDKPLNAGATLIFFTDYSERPALFLEDF
jgi:hypothetical protein